MPALAQLTLLSTLARRVVASLEAVATAGRRLDAGAVVAQARARSRAERALRAALRDLGRAPDAVAAADPAARRRLAEELRVVRRELNDLLQERHRAAQIVSTMADQHRVRSGTGDGARSHTTG